MKIKKKLVKRRPQFWHVCWRACWFLWEQHLSSVLATAVCWGTYVCWSAELAIAVSSTSNDLFVKSGGDYQKVLKTCSVSQNYKKCFESIAYWNLGDESCLQKIEQRTQTTESFATRPRQWSGKNTHSKNNNTATSSTVISL